jgi:hypothetical protein
MFFCTMPTIFRRRFVCDRLSPENACCCGLFRGRDPQRAGRIHQLRHSEAPSADLVQGRCPPPAQIQLGSSAGPSNLRIIRISGTIVFDSARIVTSIAVTGRCRRTARFLLNGISSGPRGGIVILKEDALCRPVEILVLPAPQRPQEGRRLRNSGRDCECP